MPHPSSVAPVSAANSIDPQKGERPWPDKLLLIIVT
jgi:hypothetical protein